MILEKNLIVLNQEEVTPEEETVSGTGDITPDTEGTTPGGTEGGTEGGDEDEGKEGTEEM